MLTQGIAEAYRTGRERVSASGNVRELVESDCDQRDAAPFLYATSAKEWLANPGLGEEVFGPLGLIVTARTREEMMTVARALRGQLTCTLHLDAEDAEDAELGRTLLNILKRKAGRVLANSFPTGVEVCDSMVHGGPYPASTNFGATSVGTLSIRRFMRPVCYQIIPPDLLPRDICEG